MGGVCVLLPQTSGGRPLLNSQAAFQWPNGLFKATPLFQITGRAPFLLQDYPAAQNMPPQVAVMVLVQPAVAALPAAGATQMVLSCALFWEHWPILIFAGGCIEAVGPFIVDKDYASSSFFHSCRALPQSDPVCPGKSNQKSLGTIKPLNLSSPGLIYHHVCACVYPH